MRKDALGAARLLALPTLALVVVALFAPGRTELAVRIYALVLCAAIIALLLLALRRAYPTETTLRLRTQARRRRIPPTSLVHIENEVALGVASAFDLHFRLAPRLRGIASGLLRSRRNVAFATSPEAARAIVGDECWTLVRPDRPAPEDRLAKGIPTEELGRVVDALEAI